MSLGSWFRISRDHSTLHMLEGCRSIYQGFHADEEFNHCCDRSYRFGCRNLHEFTRDLREGHIEGHKLISIDRLAGNKKKQQQKRTTHTHTKRNTDEWNLTSESITGMLSVTEIVTGNENCDIYIYMCICMIYLYNQEGRMSITNICFFFFRRAGIKLN